MVRNLDFAPWTRFVNRVADVERSLGGDGPFWYRGVPNSEFTLVPSLLRYANGREKEQDLFMRYKQVAARLFSERTTDWEVLFDMQHHYIPTRLVDWTEVLGVAVFFALLGSQRNDVAVYILDPARLNRKSGRDHVTLVTDEDDFDYRKIYWQGIPVRPTFPIAIEAPYQNERILAQRGRFTIHGFDPRPLDELVEEAVGKVTLLHQDKDSAEEYLKISGINEFSMFPDIVGAAPYLKAVVGLR